MMYTDEHAERLKKKAGQKWQPSNGTEGMMFIARMCTDCKHNKGDDYCDIQTRSMLYSKDDAEYPAEWGIGTDGQPTCTGREV